MQPPATLTGKQRSYLRALAHDRKPVVQIGHQGLTESVLEAVDQALVTHELIKVRVLQECPEEVSDLVPVIEGQARASVAQTIGRTLVIYRRRAENPKIVLPSGAPVTRRGSKPSASSTSKRTGRATS